MAPGKFHIVRYTIHGEGGEEGIGIGIGSACGSEPKDENAAPLRQDPHPYLAYFESGSKHERCWGVVKVHIMLRI